MAKITDPDSLTYLVDGVPVAQNLRFDTTNKTIQLVAGGSLVAKDGVTGQCLFSKIKEIIKADANLIKFALPVREMIHDESMELINGWTFKDVTTTKMVRDCGVAYVNAAGVPTAMFACFVTLGEVLSGAPYLVQSSATNAAPSAFTHVNIGANFGVNELVQIYADANGDGTPDYDYRGYAKVFLRSAGYTYDEASNTEIGYPALTYKKYNFPVTHSADAGVTVDDATLAGYVGMSITWYAAAQAANLGANGPYNFHVLVGANGHSYSEVYSWVQYQLRLATDIDAGGGVRTGQVAAALVFMDGDTLKTKYQAGVGGVHVAGLSAASYNNIVEADDTQALRTYPYTAALILEFDSFLQADGLNASYWIFDAATYATAGATLIKDAAAADMAGTVTGLTAGAKTHSYTWTADKNIVGVAVGKSNGKIAIATGTIGQSTSNKLVFVAGQDRWYSNP